ncbi:hypothetical protein T484DRAFT_1785835 [Baffinella frigidus]|nr:hypothetical protein T484DRAFT_1785835 [Cryptophyta sp. CCMP2293]|mmetsp:Transcript_52281/g.124527  ORF Transcript_52281/g.124527 Transcript_52281/m.124527 type:complete len:109 (+) Transcript_52281:119-445(+)
MSSTAISTAGKMRALAAEPANRPAMSLLLRSTIAMVVMPIAVYYLCFELLLAKGGIWDLSEDLNWRVNISGFASIAAVQVVIATHVVAAFRSDEQQFAQEKAAKAKYS